MRRVWFIRSGRSFAACMGVVALAIAIVAAWPRGTPTVGQEIRVSPPRETFLSGGARSEIVLREISETLRRIDGRLERFEQALRDAQDRPAEREPVLQEAGQPRGPGQAPVEGNNGDTQ